jgi:hypothetical protein
MQELAYQDFLKIVWGNEEPRDAPLYRGIFFNLVAAGVVKLKGEMPEKDYPCSDVRLRRLEERVKALEEAS